MNTADVAPILQRTLSAVYRFYDVFFFPINDRTPPITSQLDVSIPELHWNALRNDNDFTHRFSALTLTQPAPEGPKLAVEVVAPGGEYISFELIQLKLPRIQSVPPKRSDFLIEIPLWPTVVLRPPRGETAVRGRIQSTAGQPVGDLKVEMWLGPTVTPPALTPFTRSNAHGDFLCRFPLLKGAAESTASIHIRLNDGAIAVSPASLPIVLGRTQIIQFERM